MCVNLSIASERHHQLCKQCNMLSVSYLLLNEDICVWSYRYVSMGNPFGSEFEPLDLLFSSYVLVSFHSPHIRTKLCCDPKLSTGDDVSVSGFLCCFLQKVNVCILYTCYMVSNILKPWKVKTHQKSFSHTNLN